MSPLHVQLGRVRRRIWAQLGIAHVSSALLWTASSACIWLIVCRLFPAIPYTLEVAVALVAVGVVVALYLTWRQRPDLHAAALAADERLGLRERLTSSLELTANDGPMVDAVHRDALNHLGMLQARRDFPLLPSNRTKWAIVPILLFGLGYVLLPEFDLFGYQERALEAKVQKAERQEKASSLEKAARVLKAPENVPLSALDAKAAELEMLSEQLQAGAITEKQALAKVQNLKKTLEQEQQALQAKSQLNKFGDKAANSPMTQGLSRDLQQGNMSEAKEKLESLKKKLEEGKLSEEEKKELATSLKEIAKELGKNGKTETQAALAASLAQASAALSSNSSDGMKAAMANLEMSAQDLASAMEQLAKLDAAMAAIKDFENGVMGSSPFCRECGAKAGTCEGGQCNGEGKGLGFGTGSGAGKSGYQKGLALSTGQGGGMGGPGQGRGGRVGDLPDVNVAMTPTMLPGGMTEGKMLASILQKTAPDTESESGVEVFSGAIVKAQQEAEEALTKEEIPRGMEEFVRQYFGTLEGQPAE